jgi:hypothetical protein
LKNNGRRGVWGCFNDCRGSADHFFLIGVLWSGRQVEIRLISIFDLCGCWMALFLFFSLLWERRHQATSMDQLSMTFYDSMTSERRPFLLPKESNRS